MSKDLAYYMTQNYNAITEYIPKNHNNHSDYYFGLIEELPGCHAFGNTMIELLKEIEVVKKKYFELRLKDGEFIPESGDMSLRRPSRVRVRLLGTVEEAEE
ncbi:type II toxin-antitoxin system HicB family antitoxin [Paenibacillus nasutitermitis]|uniref:Type II toxin-antitoxin system HicB family antitoxin n=1 Tax=Paenibacillus nasutitermitis TaxID=1652958 RepID=A0A916YU24_9BACL|nr:type II toxin-antitoxin system HicB family antitoxin [Paenibacillus nasutitermitis]GGD60222.1 hypothetical protein GCM10010911_17610 [Paenibacillus nasutitermitis]